MDDINHSLELNRTVTARLPRLDIEKSEYQNLISQEEQFTFDFKHVINASQHDRELYASLSHMIWAKLIKNAADYHTFNLFSIYHWLTVVAIITAAVNVVVVSRLYFRFRALSLLVLSLPRIKGQFVFSTVETAKDQNDNTPDLHKFWQILQETISTQISSEFILVFILVILFILLILVIKRTCFAYTKSQTIVQLYLHANNDIFCSKIAELPFTSQFYRFELVPYAPEVTSSAVFYAVELE